MNQLLTARDVAEAVGASPKTIYQWAAAGTIPSLRIGGLVRFDPDQIEDWLESRRQGVAV